MAKITCTDFAFTFAATNVDNLRFSNIEVTGPFMRFFKASWGGGNSYLGNTIFENCKSTGQFITLDAFNEQGSYNVYNCQFTDCSQTSGSFNDETGAFLDAKGVNLNNCQFTNINTGSNGYAFKFYGTTMDNIVFTNVTASDKLLTIRKCVDNRYPGYMRNTRFEDVQSDGQFMYILGDYTYGSYEISNCKFTDCTQTCNRGQGQFAFTAATSFNSCEFINISSGARGYAFSHDGTKMDNVNFTGVNASNGFMTITARDAWNNKGYMKKVRFEDVQSNGQFMSISTDAQSGTYEVSNCNFIGCNQTGGLFDNNNGSFMDAKGAAFNSCKFTDINVDSSGYAFKFYGTTMDNVNITNVNASDKFMTINKCDNDRYPGYMSNTRFEDVKSDGQFMNILGHWSGPYEISNSKFINCNQTFESGQGQFAFTAATSFSSSEFINISSGCTGFAITSHGTKMDNVNFTGAEISDSFIITYKTDAWGNQGHIYNTKFEDCQSKAQFLGVIGDINDGLFEVVNTKFINCNQTYDEFPDGHGQFVAAIGALIDSCEFNNTRSGHHGGAICIADENPGFAVYHASIVRNTNFTDITSAWFAVFVHGDLDDSTPAMENGPLIENCRFVNCKGTDEYGACLGISHDNTTVKNCQFINNTGGQGTAIMIGGISNDEGSMGRMVFDGDNTKGNNVQILGCTFINNTATVHQCRWDDGNSYSTGHGGAVYIYGNDTKIDGCTFENNYAGSGNGSAVYVEGLRTSITFTNFRNHTAVDGTVYVKGDYSTMYAARFYENDAVNGAGVYFNGYQNILNYCGFYNNTAVNGAGVYAEGSNTVVFNSDFNDNNVTNQGGAVYLEGDDSIIDSNRFIHNQAFPAAEVTTGLGGGVYVKGSNTKFNKNKFEHNVARNGSAIYTDGKNVYISNEVFKENQAWSYLLVVTPTPKVSLYNTTDINVTVLHIGGDNIINAIHNAQSNTEITLNNVSYTHSSGDTVITKAVDQVPKDGAENSQEGRYIYQDDREYLQNITLIVTNEYGDIIYRSPVDGLVTDLYGQVTVTLKKPVLRRSVVPYPLGAPLDVGDYYVYAEHPEDWNYKVIKNDNTFKVVAVTDLSIDKTVSKAVSHNGDIVYWNITVTNHGPQDAVNVVVKDVIPNGLIEITAVECSDGTFYDSNNTWCGFNLTVGSSAKLVLKTTVNATNTTLVNKVNVTSDTNETNLDDNNASNETYVPPEADLSIVKLVSKDTVRKGDTVEWTIIVTNHGPDVAVNAAVSDLLPAGLEYVSDDSDGKYNSKSGIWKLGNLTNGESKTLHISTKVCISNATIVNNANVTSDTYDPDESNNTDNSSVTVDPLVDLAITIDPDVNKVNVGDTIVFTVTVVNNGPDTAVNTVASVKLPKELQLLGFKPSKGTYDRETGIWTIGDLAPGEKVVLLLNTKALETGQFVVGVSVKCDIDESDYSNNNDATVVEVVKPVTPEPLTPEPATTAEPSEDIPEHTSMPATGNPIVMVLLSLLAIVGISLKRKNKF